MAKDNISEKDIAGASYIIQFYKEIQQLKGFYADYVNVLLEMENKYKETDKASEEEKDYLKQVIQQIRKLAVLCYISYKSLVSSVKGLKKKTEIEKAYSKIKVNFVIERQDLYKFVTELNNFLLEEIIKNLLETSQNIINDIFENGK